MNLHQFFCVLRARYMTVLLCMFAAVGITLALSLAWPKHYTAVSTLVVDVGSESPTGGTLTASMLPTYIPTQIQTIRSARVAQQAFELLRVKGSAELPEQLVKESGARGKPDRWLVDWLHKRINVTQGKDSNLIAIGFTSRDPAFAAAVANAFSQAYVSTDIELKVDPARHGATWLQSQEAAARTALERAQARISDYQQKNGFVPSGEQVDHEVRRLNDLYGQLTVVQMGTAEADAKARAAKEHGSLPEMVQSELIARLKVQLGQAEAKLMEVAENLGTGHPQRQSMEAEVGSLRDRLRRETAQIASSFAAAGTVGRSREASLRAATEVQKQRLLQINRQRDELSVFTRERESAQRAYDSVLQRLNQTSLASRATQTNISVLSPALEPLRPSYPQPTLYGLLAAVIGAALGVMVAFMRESRYLPVRSYRELESSLELPVLAVFPGKRELSAPGPYMLGGPGAAR